VYPEIPFHIARTLDLLDGDAHRWRVHVKTAKLDYTLRILMRWQPPISNARLRLNSLLVAAAGAAMCFSPTRGRRKRAPRARNRGSFPKCPNSVLAEMRADSAVEGGPSACFLDINPGMNPRRGTDRRMKSSDWHARFEMPISRPRTALLRGQYACLRPARTAPDAGYDRLLEM